MAGGNGRENRLDHLNKPHYVFIDRNHRVMKWIKGAKEGIAVTDGQNGGIL